MAQYYPLNYSNVNIAAGRFSPSSVKHYNNYSFWYWARSLFQRMASIIDLEVPTEWEGKRLDFLKWCLFKYGYVIVFYSDEFGLSFQPCTLEGYDLYYQPTSALVANPLLNKEFDLGSEGQLLKLSPDYFGYMDIVDYFAEKLSMLDVSVNSSIVNSKFSYILGAKSKGAAQALKKLLDLINKGEPAVIYDSRIFDDQASKDTPFQTWIRDNMKQNYITSDLLNDVQTIINQFDREIGIPTIPYEKKERMVSSEADSTQIDAKARSTVWINTLQSSIKEVKELYPDIKLSASLTYGEATKGVTADEYN
jgi:hypothetical protein